MEPAKIKEIAQSQYHKYFMLSKFSTEPEMREDYAEIAEAMLDIVQLMDSGKGTGVDA